MNDARQIEPVHPIEQDIVVGSCAVLPPVASDLFRLGQNKTQRIIPRVRKMIAFALSGYLTP